MMTNYADPTISLADHLEEMLTPLTCQQVALELPDILAPNASSAVKAALWSGLLDSGIVEQLVAVADQIKRDLLDGTTAAEQEVAS